MRMTFGLVAGQITASKQPAGFDITGQFSAVHRDSFPVKYPNPALLVMLDVTEADLGEHEISVDWRRAGGTTQLTHGSTALTVTRGSHLRRSFPYVVKFKNLPIPDEGDYEFAISIDGETVGLIPLRARLWPPGDTSKKPENLR